MRYIAEGHKCPPQYAYRLWQCDGVRVPQQAVRQNEAVRGHALSVRDEAQLRVWGPSQPHVQSDWSDRYSRLCDAVDAVKHNCTVLREPTKKYSEKVAKWSAAKVAAVREWEPKIEDFTATLASNPSWLETPTVAVTAEFKQFVERWERELGAVNARNWPTGPQFQSL